MTAGQIARGWLGATALFASTALAVPYTFINIADSTGAYVVDPGQPLVDFSLYPELNDAGTVAFLARDATGQARAFVGNGGPIRAIAPTMVFSSDTGISINNFGVVAFNDSGGIIVSDGVSTTRISGAFPAINDAGMVAFITRGAGVDPTTSSVLVAHGGSITVIATIRVDIMTSLKHPSINNAGTVVSGEHVSTLGGSIDSIFTGSGGPLTQIATSEQFGAIANKPGINDSGTVSFTAEGGIHQSIYLASGGQVTALADTSGPFRQFGGSGRIAFIGRGPAINNAGTVVFWAGLDAGGDGIFTGPDPLADQVITVGSPLFGSTLANLGPTSTRDNLPSPGINNLGQVAFFYRLADGRTGIARADPLAAVPEPSGLALFGLALACLAALRRKENRFERMKPLSR